MKKAAMWKTTTAPPQEQNIKSASVKNIKRMHDAGIDALMLRVEVPQLSHTVNSAGFRHWEMILRRP
jgi:hypothetical protein